MATPLHTRSREIPRTGDEPRRGALHRRRRSAPVAPPEQGPHASSAPRDGAADPADLPEATEPAQTTGDGMGLIAVFVIATAVMVVGVVAVGAVDRTWILLPVVLVHWIATFWVLSYIYGLMAGGE
jgi:hypothetical protein